MQTNSPIVVVTGSAGYIGSSVVARLASRYPVIGLDRKPPRELPGNAHFLECNLTEDASVRNAFDSIRRRFGSRIASCVHLAAYYDFSGEPSPLYDKLTVEGTARVLRELNQLSTDQFIFSSTLLVMKSVEDEEDEAITEESPVEPAWDYPKSKLKAESVIRREHGTIPTVILRIAGVYDDDCNSLPLSQHIARIHQKTFHSYFFPGDPKHGQPYIHLEDLTDCIERTIGLRDKLDIDEVFLVAEPDIVSYGETQDILGEALHGMEWPTIRIPKPVAKAGAWVEEKLASDEKEPFIKPWMVDLADDHYPVAMDHARAVLGWQPTHRLRHTLVEMVRRLKENPRQWYETNGLQVPEEVTDQSETSESHRQEARMRQ